MLTTDQLLALQKEADQVYVDPALMEYAVRMVTATRNPQEVGLKDLQRYIMFGASPRASINLILTGRALAYVRGRNYALAAGCAGYGARCDATSHRSYV